MLQAIIGLIGGTWLFLNWARAKRIRAAECCYPSEWLAHLIGIILLVCFDETILPNANDQIFNLLITLMAGALLNVGTLLFAFMAKPLMTRQRSRGLATIYRHQTEMESTFFFPKSI